jgi:hypothetical protein
MQLPRYRDARPLLVREARRGRALELGHDPDPRRRDEALRLFADREFGSVAAASWFELAGNATSLLGVLALLALAGDESSTDEDLHSALELYCPWVGALSTMLDSYIDQAHDAQTGSWSAIAYYPDLQFAQGRITLLMSRVLRDAERLRHGPRHTLIVAMMIAMFLTSDSATSAPLVESTRQLRRAGGPLTRVLVPVLRCWRVLYQQRR